MINNVIVAWACNDEQLKEIYNALPGCNIIKRNTYEATLDEVKKADIIFGKVKPEYLLHAENLKWMQLNSAGVENWIDFFPKNAILTNAAGAYDDVVAEHALTLTLYIIKHCGLYTAQMQQACWKPLWDTPVLSIKGSCVLVLGLGNIGKQYARIVKAMGARVIGVTRSFHNKPEYVDELYTVKELDSIIGYADILAIFLPYTNDTHNILNNKRINAMKTNAYVINVGRGGVIDQTALCYALNSGKLGGVALDCTSPEPLDENDELWSAKNIFITPHIAGLNKTNSIIANQVQQIFLSNLSAFLAGGCMDNVIINADN